MHRKRLITLIAFLGILLCGACFLPPPRPATPPRPPRPARSGLDLRGCKRLRVVATSKSDTHHLDAGMLEQCVAASINQRHQPGIPPATGGGSANAGDAVLWIDVEQVSANAETQQLSDKTITWDFDLTFSASLVRSDGVALWNAPNQLYQGVVITEKGSDPWTSSGSLSPRLRQYVCDPLTVRMLSGGG